MRAEVAALREAPGRTARAPAATRAPGRWLPLRLAFTSCVLGAAAFALVFPAYDTLWFELGAGLVAGLFAALLLLARDGGRVWQRFDFLAFQLCLTLVLAEVGLRALAHRSHSQLFARMDVGPQRFLEQSKLPPGFLWWGFPVNSEGHYDEEFGPRANPDQTLVASIGDSFSIGSVHHSQHFTTVAERVGGPGLRVDNYGAAGIGPPEYLDLVLHVAETRAPDLIVVNLFVGNDLGVKRVREHFADQRLRRWLDRNNLLTYQVPHRLLRLRSTGRRRPGSDPKLNVLERIEGPQHRAELIPWSEDPRLEPATFDRRTFLDIELSRARGITTAARLDPLLELLRTMRDSAGETPLGFVLIPDELQVEDALWEELVELQPDLAGRARDLPQQVLGAFFEAERVPYLDLLPILREVPLLEDGRRHVYHRQDTHFNARGNDEAGRALARFIEAQLGTDAAAAADEAPSNPGSR